jgi:uncharacterized protein YdaU (DUF1376 family)
VADLPMMPFYPDAYMADTMHLTLEQHGAYLKLLMIMWRMDARILDDDKTIARMLSISVKKWKVLRPVIVNGTLLAPNGKYLEQKKLKKVHSRSQSMVSQRRSAGERSAAARALKTNNVDPTTVEIPLPGSLPIPLQRKSNDRSNPVGHSVATPITIIREDSKSKNRANSALNNLRSKIADLTGLDNRPMPMDMGLVEVWMERYTERQIIDGIKTYTEKTSYDWGRVNSLKYFEGGIIEQADKATDKIDTDNRELLRNMDPADWQFAKSKWEETGRWISGLGPEPGQPGYKGPD